MWNNLTNNQEFYEKKSIVQSLSAFSHQGGLSNHADLKSIEQWITPAQYVLEIGAGFGRVIEYFAKQHSHIKLHALENSQYLYNYLLQKYGQQENCTLNHGSITNYLPKNLYFDTVLWMWSGLSDFASHEQSAVIQQIFKLLKPGGNLCMDVFPRQEHPSNASSVEEHNYIIKAEDAVVRGYLPSSAEIINYSNKAGFEKIISFQYATSTNRQRVMYILSKKH